MSETKLEKARAYEEAAGSKVPADLRPRYHLSSRCGWMNDPNGFSFYGGKYHMFYQYYPYDNKWGPMHWAHAESTDLLHWEYLPVILAPEEDYDGFGCFSGSCETLPDGRHLAIYTGVAHSQTIPGKGGTQTQNIAIGDGLNYEKYAGNPVITPEMLPEGSSFTDFRDPKIWRCKDGSYRTVIAAMDGEGHGIIVLFSSEDGLTWQFENVLAHDTEEAMWECPDIFDLDGVGLFLTSQLSEYWQGSVLAKECKTMYFVGECGEEVSSFTFDETSGRPIDLGLDFYAPQTMVTPDGRRIMIAWMQNWETSACRLHDLGFMGQMTVPRELSIKNGRLYQLPVRELERYRVSKVEYENILVSGELSLSGINGRYLDMEVSIRPVDVGSIYKWFRIYVAKDGEHYTLIRFRPDVGTVKVDRTHSGFPHDIVNIREIPVNAVNGVIKFRVVMDRYSLELFVNDGEQAASFVIYTPIEAGAISFASDGNLIADIVKYELDTEIDR